MKLYSWNVNGIRAVQGKGFLDWLATTQPDILGIQETKASPEQLDDALKSPPGYETYWAVSSVKKGYSGVALYTRIKPQSVQIGLGIENYDQEGRTIIAEYDDFTFITAYFPNGSNDHSRVPFKLDYYQTFLDYINRRRAEGRPIIFCGDLNTAHQEIDLARPKQNIRTTGFLPEERVWLDKYVDAGYIDIFRILNPDLKGAYNWWSYRGGARGRNVGWRIDYFFITSDLRDRVESTAIHPDIMGSDHCPISLTLK
ncbi:MAG: exodeoxyribonuclease III [Chloroflexota bacterium]